MTNLIRRNNLVFPTICFLSFWKNFLLLWAALKPIIQIFSAVIDNLTILLIPESACCLVDLTWRKRELPEGQQANKRANRTNKLNCIKWMSKNVKWCVWRILINVSSAACARIAVLRTLDQQQQRHNDSPCNYQRNYFPRRWWYHRVVCWLKKSASCLTGFCRKGGSE